MTADNDLVVRTWRATATSAGAREYHRYFAGTLLPQLRDLPGFAGGYLLSRDVNGTDTARLSGVAALRFAPPMSSPRIVGGMVPRRL